MKYILELKHTRGARPAQSVQHKTLDPGAVSTSPTLGVEMTQNKIASFLLHSVVLKEKKRLQIKVTFYKESSDFFNHIFFTEIYGFLSCYVFVQDLKLECFSEILS